MTPPVNFSPSIPVNYTPFSELTLCSVKLVNVPVPFVFKKAPICLIGKGRVPSVWLAAPTDASGDKWEYVVYGGQSLHQAVEVVLDPAQKSVQVKVGGKDVLHAMARTIDKAEASLLDLRPFGLPVHGNSGGLSIGHLAMSNTQVNDVPVAFDLGD